MESVDLVGLFNEVIRFETELWNVVDKRLRLVYDLPLTWFELMQVMNRTPRCRVNDIVEALSITVGGTSKLVDRIEAAGLCQRQPDPEDKRSSLLELTAAGREKLTDATQTFREELEIRIGSTVSQRSLAQFAATVQKLRQGLLNSDEKRRPDIGVS